MAILALFKWDRNLTNSFGDSNDPRWLKIFPFGEIYVNFVWQFQMLWSQFKAFH